MPRNRIVISLMCILSVQQLVVGQQLVVSQDVFKFGISFSPLGNATLDPNGATLVVNNIGASGADGFSVAPGGQFGARFHVVMEPNLIALGGFVRFGNLNAEGNYDTSITEENIGGGLVEVSAAFPVLGVSTRRVRAFTNGVVVKDFEHSGQWDARFVSANLAGNHIDDIWCLGDRSGGVWVPDEGDAALAQVTFPDGSEFFIDKIEFTAFRAGANLPPPQRVAWTFKDVSSFTLTGAAFLPIPKPMPALSEWGLILLALSLLTMLTIYRMRPLRARTWD